MINTLEDKCGTCPLFRTSRCPIVDMSKDLNTFLPTNTECNPRRMWRKAENKLINFYAYKKQQDDKKK